MAGIYLFLTPEDKRRADHRGRSIDYFEDEMQETVATDRFCCIWSGTNDVDLWGPAEDRRTGNRVITSGRVSYDDDEWRNGDRLLQYSGGIASRILLDRYNANGIDGILRHNGPAAVLIWDDAGEELHLLTDHMGYQPVFLYRPESLENCVISTSPDAMAGDPAVESTLDRTAIAEFLSGWRATPPNTYYEQIKYAGAATHHVWSFKSGTYRVSTYWEPFQEEFYRDIDEASDALEEALTGSIRIRTAGRLSPVVCFTSGGQDSRAVLFSAASEGDVIALNLFDQPGRDARIAQDLCIATGTRYVGLGRDTDYYPRFMRTNVRVGNGMWSLEDQHYVGTRDFVRALGARTVMTACTTDWIFKGYGLEKTYRRFLGKNLPIQKLTSERIDSFLPNGRLPVSREYREKIDERYRNWIGNLPRQLDTDRDWLLAEDKRARPACYAVSVSGGVMYRAFPYDTFLGDRRIADCYSKMRPIWKLNSRVWGLTVRRMAGRAAKIADSGTGFVPGDSIRKQLMKFGIGWIKRRLTGLGSDRQSEDSIVMDGSWPNFGWCIRHSEEIARVWREAPSEDRELLNGVFDEDLWATDLNSWSKRPHDYLRLLTVLVWRGLRR